jgi:hypothetical protein
MSVFVDRAAANISPVRLAAAVSDLPHGYLFVRTPRIQPRRGKMARFAEINELPNAYYQNRVLESRNHGFPDSN